MTVLAKPLQVNELPQDLPGRQGTALEGESRWTQGPPSRRRGVEVTG